MGFLQGQLDVGHSLFALRMSVRFQLLYSGSQCVLIYVFPSYNWWMQALRYVNCVTYYSASLKRVEVILQVRDSQSNNNSSYLLTGSYLIGNEGRLRCYFDHCLLDIVCRERLRHERGYVQN